MFYDMFVKYIGKNFPPIFFLTNKNFFSNKIFFIGQIMKGLKFPKNREFFVILNHEPIKCFQFKKKRKSAKPQPTPPPLHFPTFHFFISISAVCPFTRRRFPRLPSHRHMRPYEQFSLPFHLNQLTQS